MYVFCKTHINTKPCKIYSPRKNVFHRRRISCFFAPSHKYGPQQILRNRRNQMRPDRPESIRRNHRRIQLRPSRSENIPRPRLSRNQTTRGISTTLYRRRGSHVFRRPGNRSSRIDVVRLFGAFS